MKTRTIVILGIVAFVSIIAWLLIATTTMSSIPSDQFGDALRQHPDITISSEMTGGAQSLPLVMRIRFPKQTSRVFIGFPDRSDRYVLTSESGHIECIAHVRSNEVCYVTLNGNAGVDAMRHNIQDLFPRLLIE